MDSRGLKRQGLTSARAPRSCDTHRTSSSGGLIGTGVAADERDDKLGGWGSFLAVAVPRQPILPWQRGAASPHAF